MQFLAPEKINTELFIYDNPSSKFAANFIGESNILNIDSLKKKIYSEVRKIHIKRFPYNNFLYPDLD